MHVTAIIAAGGRGLRFGGAQPKQLLSIGGRTILERSVMAFASHPSVDALIVALPQPLVDDPPAYLRAAALRPIESLSVAPRDETFALHGSGKPLRIVAGGERRQDSVANAFRAAGTASDIIVIHDAARPFASADLIARTIAAAALSGAALAAVQARDTVKRAAGRTGVTGSPAEAASRKPQGGPEQGRTAGHDVRTVAETLPRETIFLAQTPQAFRRDVLRQALEIADRDGLDATDEAGLVERAGFPVQLVEGDASNIKITTPEDLPLAEAIAQSLAREGSVERLALQDDKEREGFSGAAPARSGRAGTGYDLHRLVAGRPLVLGGVTIPSERGGLGHSDADVVCHSITDAILGGVCLGDIGRHFPDSDPRWKDASSLDLLHRAAALVAAQGFEVGNVDVTVILEAPRIRDHVDAMRAAVAQAIGIDVARVSIKGKTNEGVDAIGRGEAVAAHAIALIRAIENLEV
jgi:2-C-methyl-D-erythritol 4-phosphate cytidylyltransferase/2-C-methyl-D-erythritol 2,4-cyclodiphosphate synthase